MKTLYFGEGTQVAETLLSISRMEAEGDVAEYPSVAALGYGVLALETYSPEPTRERLQEKAITEYDPFAL